MNWKVLLAACAALSSPMVLAPGHAEVIGTTIEGSPLTIERIEAELPPEQQRDWLVYLLRSAQQMAADRASLSAEIEPGETPLPLPAPFHTSSRNLPLDREPSWYGSEEARQIADTIVSYQTPAGGWAKNQDRTGPPRQPGQRYANDAETMSLDRSNLDTPIDRYWNFVGTFDNDATIAELRFLHRVAEQLPGGEGDAYRASILRGIDYILDAQYPNGGWPQVYPLEGRFHDAITLNDNVIQQILDLLGDVATAPEYSFVPQAVRAKAAQARERGIDLLLAAQFEKDGGKLGWAQQVGPLTLAPVAARNYEPASLASAESAELLQFLMRQPNPSLQMKEAIIAAARWLEEVQIEGVAWGPTPEGRKAVADPDAPPIWSRLYALDTGRPIFGDVDKRIHTDVNDISRERRDGYSWYTTAPSAALAQYAAWAAQHGGPAL